MGWVSLAPEATLWLTEWLPRRRLIGRSHRCTEPPFVQRLPVCTRANAPRTGWERYLGPYAPDFAILSSLKPEGILLLGESLPPDLSEEELVSQFQKTIGYPARIFFLRAQAWPAYESETQQLAAELGVPERGARWLQAQKRAQARLAQKVQHLNARPTVLVVTSGYPVPLVGGWALQLVSWAGGQPLHPRPFLDWTELLAEDPDVIIFSLMGASLRQVGEALGQWSRQSPIQSLSAFRQKRLYAFHGVAGLFFSSPLLMAAAEALYELLHTPNYRYNQHLGRLWAPLL
ncbi:MAG: ABC transporter substrate-binding protein [Bacteroidia bacterium]|nr:ABC transporter substrate-binding protein [Bacteroidia bacterium]MDW8089333.1 ABC transporter substrate-binding protein [Bacteroidia bacterium]